MKDPVTWTQFVATFSELLPLLPSHHAIFERIVNDDWDDMPNLLFYGAVGFPISFYVWQIIEGKFGKCSRQECTFQKDCSYIETPFSIEIDLAHPNNAKCFDHVNELIKSIISTKTIMLHRHVIVLHNIDMIQNKTMFRVLLERFSTNALFLCTTHALPSLEPPLRSRFLLTRIPLCTEGEIVAICQRMNIPVYHASHRNILTSLLAADLLKENEKRYEDVATFQYHYPPLGAFLQDNPKPKLEAIRTFSNKACQRNIEFTLLAQDLLSIVPSAYKDLFTRKAAEIEQQLAITNRGREPLYYEWLCCTAFLIDRL